jgi:hypothetical protein
LCFGEGDWPSFRPPNSFGGVHLESERSIRIFLAGSRELDDGGIDRVGHLLVSAIVPVRVLSP